MGRKMSDLGSSKTHQNLSFCDNALNLVKFPENIWIKNLIFKVIAFILSLFLKYVCDPSPKKVAKFKCRRKNTTKHVLPLGHLYTWLLKNILHVDDTGRHTIVFQYKSTVFSFTELYLKVGLLFCIRMWTFFLCKICHLQLSAEESFYS
jgi:hypothetical protein